MSKKIKADPKLIRECYQWVKQQFFTQYAAKHYAKADFTAAQTTLTESKIGGLPYLPKGNAALQNTDGKHLRLLAQINCTDLKGLEHFPSTGILQFFILDNWEFGIENGRDGYAVRYYPEISEHYTEAELAEYYRPYAEDEECFPILQECKLQFRLTEQAPVLDHATCVMLCGKYLAEHGIEVDYHTKEHLQRVVQHEYENEFSTYDKEDDGEENHSQCGGYPYFTQNDPRDEDKGLADYNVLLFQLDSSFDEDGEEIVMIGDMGVMNFFIRQDDLQRRDFSDVLYSWDCC
jgi:hypothetical protein